MRARPRVTLLLKVGNSPCSTNSVRSGEITPEQTKKGRMQLLSGLCDDSEISKAQTHFH